MAVINRTSGTLKTLASRLCKRWGDWSQFIRRESSSKAFKMASPMIAKFSTRNSSEILPYFCRIGGFRRFKKTP